MKHMQERPSVNWATPVDVRALLANDHARLGKLFDELVVAFRAAVRDDCAALWSAFESSLDAHMALEEQLVLPESAKVDPAEAAALGREHAAIRASLSELGVGVELHCTNAETVERFIRVLENHAQREDALMYAGQARICTVAQSPRSERGWVLPFAS
jgi:hypothetical protein